MAGCDPNVEFPDRDSTTAGCDPPVEFPDGDSSTADCNPRAAFPGQAVTDLLSFLIETVLRAVTTC